jgi:hypothetical protein
MSAGTCRSSDGKGRPKDCSTTRRNRLRIKSVSGPPPKKLDSSEALSAAPSPGNLIAGRIGGISAYDPVVIAWGYDCCTNANADATAHIGPTISAAPIDAADMNTASLDADIEECPLMTRSDPHGLNDENARR